MKKQFLTSSVFFSIISLMAFALVSCNSSNEKSNEQGKISEVPQDSLKNRITEESLEFFFDIHARHSSTITNEKLQHVKTLEDLIPENVFAGNVMFKDVRIGIFPRNEEMVKVVEEGTMLTPDQIALLKTAGYSDDIYIEAFCKRKNEKTGVLEDKCFVDYMTVVPESQAEFKNGDSALLKHLRDKSEPLLRAEDFKKLTIGRTCFTLTKEGEIENVKFESTSGFNEIDDAMIELISNLKGEWIPAKDSLGNAISQELVYIYGVAGC